MAVNWQNLATAAACRLEFEQLCDRGDFTDESALVRTCVEYVQAGTNLAVRPELNHPDLPGNKRLDAAGEIGGAATYAFVLEAKWLKAGGGARQYDVEIVEDLLRLESLQANMGVGTDRALVVAGHRSTVEALGRKNVQTGGGTTRLMPHVLQERDQNEDLPQNQTRIAVRECDPLVRRFWSRMARRIDSPTLPVSYQVALAGYFQTGSRQDSVEAQVWLVRRSRNRSTFAVPGTW